MRRLILFLLLATIGITLWGDSLSSLLSIGIYHELKRVSGNTITRDIGNFKVSIGFEDGTATDSLEASKVYSIRGEVSSASPLTYDLASISGQLGGTTTFSRVKCFGIKNLDLTDSLILGSGSLPWKGDLATASVETFGPNGGKVIWSPYEGLDASVTDRLIYLDSTDVASFDLLIVGI